MAKPQWLGVRNQGQGMSNSHSLAPEPYPLIPAFLQLIVRTISRSRQNQIRSRSRHSIPVLVDLHAQTQTHRGKYFLDLVQRLAAEILRLEHFRFSLLNQFADRLNIRILQAVVAAHRKLKLL